MTVTVKKLGGSVAVVIPKGVASEMELTAGTALEVSVTADGIMLRKQGRRLRRPLGHIVAEMNPQHYRRRGRELAGDGPVGKEIW